MPHAHSGPARVIAAGTVTTFAGFPLLIGIDVPLRLEIAMRFVADPALPDVAVRTTGQDDHQIQWDLVNFDGSDGRGSAEPVLMAEVGDALIYFHFRVFRYGRTDDRTVHYTFYEVAKSAVGWVGRAGPTPG